MQMYQNQHQYYCGIDLHSRTIYLCIVDHRAQIHLHKNIPAAPEPFLQAITPYRDDLVVGAECMFSWYWLADLCADHDIAFVLGHALYMKAIHGAKAKNDRLDSQKIALLLKGGLFPLAYVYPRHMRATRDLLRRRTHFMRKRSELNVHILMLNCQYNLPPLPNKICYKKNRLSLADRFSDSAVKQSIELDLALMDIYDSLLTRLESYILTAAQHHDHESLLRLRTVPGIGKIIALTILYEIGDINRFATVQDFVSYARLICPLHESGGKILGRGAKKIGNSHLKWAFSEASVLFLRNNPDGQKLLARIERKHSKSKALNILAHKLGRAVYFILKRKTVFDMNKMLSGS